MATSVRSLKVGVVFDTLISFRSTQFRVPTLIKRKIEFNYIISTGDHSTPRGDVPVSHEVDHQVHYNRDTCPGWISTPSE